MGCGGSRTKLEGVDQPLDSWMEPVGCAETDKKFKEVSELIADLEAVRANCVDEFDELVVLSGATAYKQPCAKACLTSFIIVAELESPEFAKGITPHHDAPFFTHKAKLTAKTLKIHDQLVKFAKGLKGGNPWDEDKHSKLQELIEWANFVDLEKTIALKLKDKKVEL
jgi:hypothetical protein